ncbi:KRR1 interacting protein 1 [Macleaya cordata]|uniref:KRR1 interacting protein 1 n=1 Tax=Macleaya cordata TaxID=56857 RepID=A0A200R4N2_MACCD|nr:KRR1 interacting protein 1 [Macleaya cordata]
MGMNLFDGSDDTDDISKIETNKEFARRYEHNKKREDLQRLEELKKKGVVGDSESSSSESEEDDDDLVDFGKKDMQFLHALVRVKKKDPIINQKDAKLFESEDEDEEESQEGEENHKSAKEKPMYLKDVVAKQLIEEGPEFEENESKLGVKSYSEEQDEFRKAFLNAAETAFDDDDDDEGDLLMEKKKQGGEDEEGGGDEIERRWDEYFGRDENLDEKEKFLKNFFVNKMWVDKDKGKKPFNDDLYVISEDEEEVEKQEKYEAEFNFRYEEGAGDRVLGHARFTEGSVRKKSNARAVQRKSKEERMAQAEFERKEELKHLKNLKKKEIMEKLDKIRAIAGIAEGGACALNEDDLEEDFDPNEYDRKMKETFDVDYYEAEDADPVFENGDGDIEKPDFDKEDELLGLPKDWDVCGSGDGFAAVREKVLKSKAEMKDDETLEDSDQKEEELPTEMKDDETLVDSDQKDEELPEEGKRKRKRKMSLREKVALDKDLEEYYKLDYEDTIGDLKTRFKYASVPSQRYGLSAKELLKMDDKELNDYVPLKKIAPYVEKEYKVPDYKRYNQKMKNKQEVNFKGKKATKNHGLKGDSHSITSVQEVQTELNDYVPSKKIASHREIEYRVPESKRHNQKMENKQGVNFKDKKATKNHGSKGDSHEITSVTAAPEQGRVQAEKLNGEEGTVSKKSRRRRHRPAEFKLTESRLKAFGKIPTKSKNKKKN